jgi:integrase/recombinase XerC
MATGTTAKDCTQLVEDFLQARTSPHTRRTYRFALQHYAAWAKAKSVGHAVSALLGMDPAEAVHAVNAYRDAMAMNGVAPATVNNRLAVLRSLVRTARDLGMVEWQLEAEFLSGYRRETRPAAKGIAGALLAARRSGTAKGVRDAAILRLVIDLGLTNGDIHRLNVGDIDVEKDTILVHGRNPPCEYQATMPMLASAAVRTWLALRKGLPDQPCFVSMKDGARLNAASIARVIGRQ